MKKIMIAVNNNCVYAVHHELSTWPSPSYLILTVTLIIILRRRHLKHKSVKSVAQTETANKW